VIAVKSRARQKAGRSYVVIVLVRFIREYGTEEVQ